MIMVLSHFNNADGTMCTHTSCLNWILWISSADDKSFGSGYPMVRRTVPRYDTYLFYTNDEI